LANIFLELEFELIRQYINIKKVTPLCRQRKDSVKNNDKSNTAKAIEMKFLDFIAVHKEIATIASKIINPKIPNSAKT
jgi:hypothetical protein